MARREQHHRGDRHAGRYLVTAAALIAGIVLSGCNDQDRPLFIEFSNGLDETIVVRYEEPGHEMDVATLDPTDTTTFTAVFSQRGSSCHGPFVVRTIDGDEVARAEKVCPGVVWRITSGDAASPT
jgi:hypothetical protein